MSDRDPAGKSEGAGTESRSVTRVKTLIAVLTVTVLGLPPILLGLPKLKDAFLTAVDAFLPTSPASPPSAIPLPSPPPSQSMLSTREDTVAKIETQGISALLNKDLRGASDAFDKAYKLWPTFRSVDEIRKAILNASKQPDSVDWPQLYQQIAGMDLRGVPLHLQDQLHQKAVGD